MKRSVPVEQHRLDRIGWLRASVLGANDGIVSTASLVAGVAAAHASSHSVLLAGVAGLVAGAMSMAAGEYVSVHSQLDSESADLKRERQELQRNPRAECRELQTIYMTRGVDADLAFQVAQQLMHKDALGAHARDELGITHIVHARPVQAAVASALSFAGGAVVPLLAIEWAPPQSLLLWVSLSSLACLALMGVMVARLSGVSVCRSVLRTTFWGAAAIVVTAAVGVLFGVSA